MSATINWRVGTMECYPTYEQNIDVVFTVHWDCLGSEVVSGSTYNGRVYGATGVTFTQVLHLHHTTNYRKMMFLDGYGIQWVQIKNLTMKIVFKPKSITKSILL